MCLSIILFHEFGHLIIALYYKWSFLKIAIYPFGGCCKFDERINRPIKEELLILVFGPIFQCLFYFLVLLFSYHGFISVRNLLIFKNYHYTLLFFNLLPIYPLDGGRILNCIIWKILPYKKSNKIVIFFSFVFCFIFMIYYKNLNYTLMSILLGTEIILYFRRQNYLYNRLLLERYIKDPLFKKIKTIKNKNNIYKDKKHVIFYKDKYITEKDYLKTRFKQKG